MDNTRLKIPGFPNYFFDLNNGKLYRKEGENYRPLEPLKNRAVLVWRLHKDGCIYIKTLADIIIESRNQELKELKEY